MDSSATRPRNDPQGFVRAAAGLLVVDEVQRCPDLALAIKLAVDEDPRPGRFLLTGSTHLFSVREVADTLAGRMEIIELWPFTQDEREERTVTPLLDRVLDSQALPSRESDTQRHEYLERARAGGFPEAVARSADRRAAWFRSYVTSVAERESKEVIDTDRGGDIRRLLRFVAARHGSLLNVAELARDAGITERTTHRYLYLLESVFLITSTPPWWANLTSRLTKSAKLYVTDAGLAAHLRRGSERDPAAGGPIVEGFVVEEIRRQLSWSRARGELLHYRDKAGREIDALVEFDDGRLVGVEVRLTESLGRGAFDGLRHLRAAVGERMVAGIVLHAGRATHSHGGSMWSGPIDLLWNE